MGKTCTIKHSTLPRNDEREYNSRYAFFFLFAFFFISSFFSLICFLSRCCNGKKGAGLLNSHGRIISANSFITARATRWNNFNNYRRSKACRDQSSVRTFISRFINIRVRERERGLPCQGRYSHSMIRPSNIVCNGWNSHEIHEQRVATLSFQDPSLKDTWKRQKLQTIEM